MAMASHLPSLSRSDVDVVPCQSPWIIVAKQALPLGFGVKFHWQFLSLRSVVAWDLSKIIVSDQDDLTSVKLFFWDVQGLPETSTELVEVLKCATRHTSGSTNRFSPSSLNLEKEVIFPRGSKLKKKRLSVISRKVQKVRGLHSGKLT